MRPAGGALRPKRAATSLGASAQGTAVRSRAMAATRAGGSRSASRRIRRSSCGLFRGRSSMVPVPRMVHVRRGATATRPTGASCRNGNSPTAGWGGGSSSSSPVACPCWSWRSSPSSWSAEDGPSSARCAPMEHPRPAPRPTRQGPRGAPRTRTQRLRGTPRAGGLRSRGRALPSAECASHARSRRA